MGGLIDFLAGAACVAAGLYLMTIQSVGETTVFVAIAHGMGLYFIGKGLFVWRANYIASRPRVWEESDPDEVSADVRAPGSV